MSDDDREAEEEEVSLPKELLIDALDDYYRRVGKHDGSPSWSERIARIADYYCGKVRELARALHDQVGTPFQFEHLLGRSATQQKATAVGANTASDAAAVLRRHPLCPPS